MFLRSVSSVIFGTLFVFKLIKINIMKKLFSILLLTLLFVGISAQKSPFTDFYNTVEIRTQDGSYVKKEQTMEFIERNKEQISFTENWEEWLKDFWSKNPDGVIEFG